MIERLRRGRFDAAMIFTVYSQNPLPAALLCLLADVPRRLAHCRENPYQLLTALGPRNRAAAGVRHEVRRQLDLAAAVGCHTADDRLSLHVPLAARRRMPVMLRPAGDRPSAPWAAVHPGASAPSRRYPPEHFAEAAGRLSRDHGLADRLHRATPTSGSWSRQIRARWRRRRTPWPASSVWRTWRR